MAWRSSNGLHHHHHVGLGHPGRGLHHHRLVELLDRAIHAGQPTHDRGGHHRPDTLIDRAARTVGHPGHPGQPGHGLLDENIARPTQSPRRPAPAPPPASTKCCPHPARKTTHRPRPAPAPAPGRRCRPGSPRRRWPGPDTDRHRAYSGAGRARVSSLPLTVSGNASKHHHRRRAPYRPGSRSASAARIPAGSAVPVT